MFTRYAIYAAPRPGPLADFAAHWLGWDAAHAVELEHPRIPGLPRPAAELTATPRRYGFHGTLKPPFRLTQGRTAGELGAAVAALAARLAPVDLGALTLARLGSFIALRPAADGPALATLAAECVQQLDEFRSPPTEAEIARRNPASLTPRQREHLDRWGYPYVLDEFRFHLTLTGNLPEAEAVQVQTALAPHLAPLLARPAAIEDLCLFAETLDGRFRILHRYPLGG